VEQPVKLVVPEVVEGLLVELDPDLELAEAVLDEVALEAV
jgi:hypothetical protein